MKLLETPGRQAGRQDTVVGRNSMQCLSVIVLHRYDVTAVKYVLLFESRFSYTEAAMTRGCRESDC